MDKCETCGNEYHRCLEITQNGKNHIFDCFECAIQKLAPQCAGCGCRIIGHGVEVHAAIYCSSHCARGNAERGVLVAGPPAG